MKKLVLILTFIILISNCAVYADTAAPTVTGGVSGDLQYVTVSGSTISPFKFVSIRVLKPGSDVTDGMTGTEYNAVTVFEVNAVSDADGFYTKRGTFPENSDMGGYIIEIKPENEAKVTLTYNLIPIATLKQNRETILKSNDAGAVKSALVGYGEANGISLSPLAGFSDSMINSAVNIFIAARNKLSGQTLDNAKISEVLRVSAALAEIKYSGETGVTAALVKYESIFSLDTGVIFTAYKAKLSAADIEQINRNFLKYNSNGLITADDLKTNRENAVLLYLIGRGASEQSIGWYDVRDIITAYSGRLELNLGTFNLLGDKTPVYKELSGKKVYTPEELRNAFNAAVTKQYNAERQTGGLSGNNSGSTGGGGGSVSINDPDIKTPILPSPSPDVKPETVFSDLDTDAPWAKTAVENLYRRGIISGRGEGIFDPNADITREEFAKIIVLAAGLEITGEPSGFSDVPSGSWAEPYIAAAKNSGIINGKSEDEFGSGQNITREEMAAMVYRMIVRTGFSGEKGSLDFVDAEDISGYAIEAALYLSNARIINGMDGRFEPKSNSTRAQASQIVYNAIIR